MVTYDTMVLPHCICKEKFLVFFPVLKTKRNDFSFGRLNTSMHVISDEESLGILRADGVR